jgi:hypothetical protein
MRETGLFDKDGDMINVGDTLLLPNRTTVKVRFSEVNLGRDDWGLNYRAICINVKFDDGGCAALLSNKEGCYGILSTDLKIIK